MIVTDEVFVMSVKKILISLAFFVQYYIPVVFIKPYENHKNKYQCSYDIG